MKKFSIPITILFIFLSIGMFPTTSVSAKPIILSVDVWTSKGGQGEGKTGGSYKVGEQVILYLHASVECQAKLTLTGPGGPTVSQLSLPTNSTQTLPLGTADQSDIGLWQVRLEGSGFNQVKADTTSFTVTGTVMPTPPPTTVIPYTTPPVTQPPVIQPVIPPVTPPVTTSPPATTPPVKSGNIPITIDANTSSELMALLALKIADGKLASDSKLDADKNGKVDMTDARLFLKLAVKKK